MGRKNSKKQKKKHHSSADKLIKGTIEITRSGMGFVSNENMEADILIRPSDLNSALHGDTVRVQIKEGKGRRLMGVVQDVIVRKRTEFIGHLEMNKGFAFFIPETDKPMPDIFIPLPAINNAKDNDRVVVRITDWAKEGKKPLGEVVSVLDAENTNDIAMKEILLEFGFPLRFPDDALEVAARIPDSISKSDLKNRKDLRPILTFTIDPADAKDFDDAISFTRLGNGNYEIGVHIADVSHYLEPDTALDKTAYQKATSVYFPDRVNPMLPEHISNVLCSLRPDEDKLTFSANFEITPGAEIKHFWLGKTIIHSNHRFTYEEVQETIESKEGVYSNEILILNDLAQKMRRQRFEKGAINFSSQEVRFQLDDKGNPVGIMIKESKEAHQLVEEFMLLANRVVAEFLSKAKVNNKPVPFPYRIHDDPDKEKLIPFMAFANKFGYSFDTTSPESIAASFNRMLKEVQGKAEQHVLEQLGIRTMAKAKYSTQNVGHYGLGFEYYCHFTSPIRRYPDIQVHRILEEVLYKKVSPDSKLEEKCVHCSERERAAMEAERSANKYKQVQYMKNFLGDEFDGVISGVASFGFWVETIEHKCEGLVSLNSLLEYDEFRHIDEEYCLEGLRTGHRFRMGDIVRIKVVSANLSRKQLDYEWVMAGGSQKERIKKSGDRATGKKMRNK
ncbi:MAG: ribonuclease R [Bacteroidetes bacterium]|nr:ribonuclease R [Bacteroidota bacterium]